MPNRLATAISPYLRSHAENPVDWQQWGSDPFEEAVRRNVPVFVSIGYSTCHWCHVMARESFSDPVLAEYLNAHFVAIKVDREEYPDVDSSYMTSASAFTDNLGWPLNVFVTPQGKTFFAGTYWPPEAAGGHPSFRQVLEAITDAWTNRRESLEDSAAQVVEALAAASSRPSGELPDDDDFAGVVQALLDYEDTEFGGFGSAPKFPMVPVLQFLLERGSLGDTAALALVERTLFAMAASPLRDSVDGGFFRYATRRDWSEPHYERMLYDNAQLLTAYTRLAQLSPPARERAEEVSGGIADFLLDTLRLPCGAFASAQDSESTVDGTRVEGVYYSLGRVGRAAQSPPAIDAKVLTGWNGLAIDALATAGAVFGHPEWISAAASAADYLLEQHLHSTPASSLTTAFASQMQELPTLIRASVDGRPSAARATLEDYGMLARALLHLGLETGEARYAVAGRKLVDATLAHPASPFTVPDGADPVLVAHGLAVKADPSEGAYASGLSAMASAAQVLYLLTSETKYREAAVNTMEQLAPLAVKQPVAFGAALGVMSGLGTQASQLVVATPAGDPATVSPLTTLARGWYRSGSISTVLTDAQAATFADVGFELFQARTSQADSASAYLCRDFVCRLPVTDAAELERSLADVD
ncbi:MAG: thioredoxin domain-containing protein [Lacisediminihabitans sp.]